MTFSILTYDDKTGVYAGAAATGSLCVGGWVLRGDIESGLCASQGTAPSTAGDLGDAGKSGEASGRFGSRHVDGPRLWRAPKRKQSRAEKVAEDGRLA